MKSINVKLKVVAKKTIVGDKKEAESNISSFVSGWCSKSRNGVTFQGNIKHDKMYGINYEKHRAKTSAPYTKDKTTNKLVGTKTPTHYVVTVYEIPDFVFDILPKGSKLIQKNNHFKIISG